MRLPAFILFIIGVFTLGFVAGVYAAPRETFSVDPPAVAEAQAHIEQCARGYLGARLERAKHIVWVESHDVNRARTALPDTVYLDPAWRADTFTIAHEMLHIAIGRPGHPAIPFSLCGLLSPER